VNWKVICINPAAEISLGIVQNEKRNLVAPVNEIWVFPHILMARGRFISENSLAHISFILLIGGTRFKD